ncbi:enoyl-CoA hydratase/isomerase family protein [Bordetella sp. BOR01]|uniref:enoyl-CoA hydratase/isomerase family protein n=1 Tax=Bordetella sp. BOR01 TaxID=2854779 RepID=UPI001C48A56A|nr:enoyl-CoA hydratase/isomerase family protein [Bordetella sp. BOR01]MBV7482719.1 enoyl-CoA hydratase/isomerase family protein [Bordetella sp. BOR01]
MTGAPDTGAALQVARDGAVWTLTLCRPDKGNALSAELVQALGAAVGAASADGGVRLLILEGAGRHFCTGFDLSDLDRETDQTLLARFVDVELLLQALHAAPFMTLAIAHGRTMGAGADLFCACAERWVAGQASFAFPGAAFGLVLGTARLADRVGPAHASAWVEGGVPVDGAAALQAGLATRLLDEAGLDAARNELKARTQRLDPETGRAIHLAIGAVRRPRGDDGDAHDLARLVRSAARPGLRDRIAAYRAAQLRK